jgi:dihydrofolate reductase
MVEFALIAAADRKLGIGKNNQLPWRLKGELAYFTRTTTEAMQGKINAVLMGLNTWNSLPEISKPLIGRFNVVLSKEPVELPEGVVNALSFEEALSAIQARSDIDNVFVIGGASVYNQAIKMKECSRIYLTEVDGEFDCDTFFPEIDKSVFKKVSESEWQEEPIRYRFTVWERG